MNKLKIMKQHIEKMKPLVPAHVSPDTRQYIQNKYSKDVSEKLLDQIVS